MRSGRHLHPSGRPALQFTRKVSCPFPCRCPYPPCLNASSPCHDVWWRCKPRNGELVLAGMALSTAPGDSTPSSTVVLLVVRFPARPVLAHPLPACRRDFCSCCGCPLLSAATAGSQRSYGQRPAERIPPTSRLCSPRLLEKSPARALQEREHHARFQKVRFGVLLLTRRTMLLECSPKACMERSRWACGAWLLPA